MASNATAARLERFDGCGSDCVVEFSPSQGRHRLRANYCGDRFCLPCARARALKVERNLVEWTRGERVRFLTFTLRANDAPLSRQLDRLIRSFAKVRETKVWRAAVRAGAYVIEIKRGSGSGKWHPHLHVLVIGSYIEQAKLSQAWHRATGDSFRVDVREVKDHAKGVGYVAKYAGKGWSRDVLEDHDSLVECVLALRGRRLLGTFGAWRGNELDSDGGAADDWQRVGRLVHVVDRANAGEAWARGVMLSLNAADLLEVSRVDPATG